MARVAKITAYYGDLKKFIDNGNHNKVIKAANRILSEAPGELKAWQCKVVAHIQMDQFSEALAIVMKSKFNRELAFEQAYCEYRLNMIDAAYETVCNAAEVTPRIEELKAQILYRLERYKESYDLYKSTIRTTSDDFDQERFTNMVAVAVNRTQEGENECNELDIDDSSYESMYNGACHLLARAEISEALEKLQETEKQCRSYIIQEEGATEDEVNEEVAIIRVQQGHCLQLLGRERDAMNIYNAVLKTKPEDASLIAIINNNIVAATQQMSVFDSRKRMKIAMASGLEHKLNSRQRSIISLNNCILAYQTNQEDVCRTETQKLVKEFPQQSMNAQVIQAALLGREGKVSEARELLMKTEEDNAEEATNIKLIAVQILLEKGDMKGAYEVLMTLDEPVRYRQGIVSSIVTLCMALGDHDGASAILRQSVDWHKKNETSAIHLKELWRHAADYHLRSGDAPAAAASLLELRKLDTKDLKILAQLVLALSQYDTNAAQTQSRNLPPVKKIMGHLDAEALEATSVHRYFKKVHQVRGEVSPGSPVSPKAVTTPGKDLRKTKKKKKRKPRYPKDYNPNETPDPERWLPRWQRKGYRKKKDRRIKEVMKGTQGVSSEAADKFDITKTAGTKPVQTAVSPQPESLGPRRQILKKKGGGKKKKSGW